MNRGHGRHDGTPMERLVRLVDLVTPMALRVTATLRLVDHMRAGAGTSIALAAATGADADALRRLMRHLSAVGVLRQTAVDEFEPTEVGELLADEHPAQQRSWLDLTQAVGRADLAFARLLEAVRTGRGTYESVYGLPFWADLSANPELGESFDKLMATEEEEFFADPVAAHDWSGVRHVLDPGGAPGGLMKAIARAAPHIRGTIVELPSAAARTRKVIAAAGLADRVDVCDGDFFDPLPVTADVIVLSFVLLNWSDDDARRILRRCLDALAPGGRILLLERADPSDSAAPTSSDVYFSVLDLRMLVFLGGRVRTGKEWATLAASVGLTVESTVAPIESPFVPFDSCLLKLTRSAEMKER